MRIVVDMQFANTGSAKRGIGRYSMGLIKALYELGRSHEFIFAFADFGQPTDHAIRQELESFVDPRRIVTWKGLGPTALNSNDNCQRFEVSCILRETFYESLNADLVFVPSLFEGLQDDVALDVRDDGGRIPSAVVLYDLIPLHFADVYLRSDASKKWYQRQLDAMKRADRLLAISSYALNEAVDLGVARAENCTPIFAGLDPRFRPMDRDPERDSVLRKAYKIEKPFLLTAGGVEFRKNVERLIAALGTVQDQLRDRYQLVVLGCNDTFSQNLITEVWPKKFGVPSGQVVAVPYVDDEELIWFYNQCEVFVFPSLHEGFGFPPLEAMACGAATLSANTTSLPEVVQRSDIMFDPLSAESMAAQIVNVLHHEEFRLSLKQWGPQHAAQFTWQRSAELALSAIENIAPRAGGMDGHDPRRRTMSAIAAITGVGAASDAGELERVADALAWNESAARRMRQPFSLPEPLRWRVEGPFDSSYSLALVNREFARAMDAIGQNVILHSTEGFGDFRPNPDFLTLNGDLAAFFERSTVIPPENADVVSRNLYPPRVSDIKGDITLLHSYGWEETGFPHEWVMDFNESLDGVLCMSHHVKKVMIDHGVICAVGVGSLGVDHWERVTSNSQYSLQTRGSFRFLHVSSCFPRKGVEELLEAFGIAFSSRDDVALVIKTFPNPHNEVERWIAEARHKKPDYPEIVVIEDDLDDSSLKALYLSCQAAVFPSKAEGFGLPIAEAMLSGLSVIATGWSGQMDFCDAETAWLVDFDFEKASSHFNLYGSAWARPRVSELAGRMLQVYSAPVAEREARRDLARARLLADFSWTKVAQRSADFARGLARGKPTAQPRIVWVSTWNSRCGIASYSAEMVRGSALDCWIAGPDNQEATERDGPYVQRVWSVGDDDDLSRLTEAVAQINPDAVVIQFNYGFYHFNRLARFIETMKAADRVVVITMHSTVDPAHVPNKSLAMLGDALRQCDRILVHSIGDMNRLKAIGIVDNVTLFPLGVIDRADPATAKKRASKRFTIGSYGFALPNKGLPELIEAVAILKKRGIAVRLKLINAEYPAAESRQLIEQMKRLIAKLKLSSDVDFDHRYLSDEESFAALSACDLLVFPYQYTGESASAAVRHGLATGRPVAVTPLAIFGDLTQAAFVLPDTSANGIADGIATISEKIRTRAPDVAVIAKEADNWRRQHRYSILSQRLQNMIIALCNQKTQNLNS